MTNNTEYRNKAIEGLSDMCRAIRKLDQLPDNVQLDNEDFLYVHKDRIAASFSDDDGNTYNIKIIRSKNGN